MIIKNRQELIGLAQNQAEKKLRRDLLAILEYALSMSDPFVLVEKFLSQIDCKKYKKIFVVGAGKGTYRMAMAAEKFLGAKLTGGCISVPAVIKNGYLKKIKVNLAGHPLPNSGSVIGAQKILEIIKGAGSGDLVLGLFSGGASALMCSPVDKVSLADKIKVTELLLRSGATIDEMNAVRKHLSQIKGGWLGQAAGNAKFTVFYLSDVVGDDLSTVASGPTVADISTFGDAINVLSKYSLLNKISSAVKKYLENGQNGLRQETPKKIFANVKNIIIGSHKTLAKAAFEKAKQLKYQPIIITGEMKGETEKIGVEFLARAASGKKKIFIAAGETTFKVRTKNPGGRNQQMCLSVLSKLKQKQVFVAFDSDGVDGVAPEQVGGVIIGTGALKNAQKLKIDIIKTLKTNDSYNFFKKVGGLIKTGYVGTNLGDIVLFSK
ncbi:MAG: DUF4147 domain-containing protein [Candidatus Magasanikbacteria bacterium]|nr:DUF4147 domain-containing protein [Candidatus Magasanikbacteria bacterium]